MVHGLTDLGAAVPDQRVAVRCKPFVLCRLRPEQEPVRGYPLLCRELERRDAMRPRDDHPAPRKDVRRVARIARGGVHAEGLLEVHLRTTQVFEIAEHAVGARHVFDSRLSWSRPPDLIRANMRSITAQAGPHSQFQGGIRTGSVFLAESAAREQARPLTLSEAFSLLPLYRDNPPRYERAAARRIGGTSICDAPGVRPEATAAACRRRRPSLAEASGTLLRCLAACVASGRCPGSAPNSPSSRARP